MPIAERPENRRRFLRYATRSAFSEYLCRLGERARTAAAQQIWTEAIGLLRLFGSFAFEWVSALQYLRAKGRLTEGQVSRHSIPMSSVFRLILQTRRACEYGSGIADPKKNDWSISAIRIWCFWKGFSVAIPICLCTKSTILSIWVF